MCVKLDTTRPTITKNFLALGETKLNFKDNRIAVRLYVERSNPNEFKYQYQAIDEETLKIKILLQVKSIIRQQYLK